MYSTQSIHTMMIPVWSDRGVDRDCDAEPAFFVIIHVTILRRRYQDLFAEDERRRRSDAFTPRYRDRRFDRRTQPKRAPTQRSLAPEFADKYRWN